MYKISDFEFEIINHDNIMMPSNFKKFYVDHSCFNYQYDIYVTNQIEVESTKFTINKDDIKIVTNNNLETRYLYIKGDFKPYAKCIEIDNNHSKILVDHDYIHLMDTDTMFVSLLCLERRMNNFNQYILHSAYIIYNNEAILFTAPSGTGKSTQANLWQKYRNARIINGDKSLLVKKGQQYYASGWPICGSSNICFNESYPIKAIVVLSQGLVNKVEVLDYKDSVKKLLSEMTINYHNVNFINQAMDFIEDLVKNVKVYHLTCDISKQAVECLERELNNGCFR